MKKLTEEKYIWIFHGQGGRFASGVFENKEDAESWIEENKLQGVLTKYPVNTGVYDWAVAKDLFQPKTDLHTSPEFIQKFTSASQEHYHFEGEEDEG